MRCRGHNYVYTQGYFYCTKCGHRRYHSHRGHRRKNKKIIIVPIVVALVGIAVYFNSETIINFSNNAPQIINEIPLITPTPESTQRIIPEPEAKPIPKPIPTTTLEQITKTIIEPIEKALEIKPTNMTAIAFYIHVLINEERRSNGLSPLSWNPTIAQAALNHSTDMAKRDYFAHESPEGYDFTYRYSQAGFNCQIPTSSTTSSYGYGGSQTTTYYSTGGENIMFLEGYYGEENIARQSVEGWMNSAGHRENILTSYFLSEGIGVAESENGKIYATQDFC